MKKSKEKIITLAYDYAGFDKKQVLIQYFQLEKIAYMDFGCFSAESCNYPDFAYPATDAIEKGDFEASRHANRVLKIALK